MVIDSVNSKGNLLLNIGLMPDGNLDQEDANNIREAGRILKERGTLN